MSSVYGKRIKISVFGQSHSEAIGVVIDGLPSGIEIDRAKLSAYMERRVPGRHSYSTQRKESDKPEIISGLVGDITCGAPLCAVIHNKDIRSKDYENLRDIPRPSHSDYTAYVKYGGHHDIRGGGHFSGRLTAPLCVAGGICMQILESKGIMVGAHILSIGSVNDLEYDPVLVSTDELTRVKGAEFPVLSESAGVAMKEGIEKARQECDSLGGVIECAAVGVPAGYGEPMFDGIENRIASAVFAIPAVRGIEFGSGFKAASMRGSEHNDAFYIDDGVIKTRTNNHGGILGGISSGMPLLFRVAIKPTPSIAKEQDSISIRRGTSERLLIQGRHDPCIVPRAVVCIESAAAIVICDFMT